MTSAFIWTAAVYFLTSSSRLFSRYRLARVVLDLDRVGLLVERELGRVRHPAFALAVLAEVHLEQRERVVVGARPVDFLAEADDARRDDDDAPAAVLERKSHRIADVGAEPHRVVRIRAHVAGEIEPSELRLLFELAQQPVLFLLHERADQVLALRRVRPPVDVDADVLVGAGCRVAHVQRPPGDGHPVGRARRGRRRLRPGGDGPQNGQCPKSDQRRESRLHADTPSRRECWALRTPYFAVRDVGESTTRACRARWPRQRAPRPSARCSRWHRGPCTPARRRCSRWPRARRSAPACRSGSRRDRRRSISGLNLNTYRPTSVPTASGSTGDDHAGDEYRGEERSPRFRDTPPRHAARRASQPPR